MQGQAQILRTNTI